MSRNGASRRAKPRTLEDRVKELQAQIDAKKKKLELKSTIDNARKQLAALRKK